MLPAIHFNDNSELMAGEIGEIRAGRRLTSKVMLLERRLPQVLPQLLFGFGRITAQDSRARHAVVGWTRRSLCGIWHPPPPPPPRRALRARGEGSRSVLAEMLNSKVTFLTKPRRLRYAPRLRRRLLPVRARA